MAEMHGVADETMKRPGHVSFGRSVHKNPGGLVGKVVTGCSVQRPIGSQFFRAAQNFFRDHVNRAPIFRQRHAKDLGATALERL